MNVGDLRINDINVSSFVYFCCGYICLVVKILTRYSKVKNIFFSKKIGILFKMNEDGDEEEGGGR